MGPAISLVIPTIHRKKELERLFKSICAQVDYPLKNLECIVCDQNPDGYLNDIFESAPANTLRLGLKPKGVSNAKNQGIAIAQGEYILFPDDDCWYPKDFFKKLTSTLSSHPQVDGVFFRARDPKIEKDLVKFPEAIQYLRKPSSLAFCAPQIAQVYKTAAVKAVGGFNEDFKYGEETDLALRVLAHSGHTVFLTPEIEVYHPMVDARSMTPEKASLYGRGFGVVCVRHGLYAHWLYKTLKQVAAAFFYFLKADMYLFRQSIAIAKGRFLGGLSEQALKSGPY